MSQLNPKLASLYRIFLRATSASVLHKGIATKNLRKLYRPTFEAAAKAVRRIESPDAGRADSLMLKIWLDEFDRRVNKTLNLLYTSSNSRGLPHKLVQNLYLLSDTNYEWSKNHYLSPRGTWNPHLPPNSPQYKIIPKDMREGRRDYNKLVRDRRLGRIDDNSLGTLGEVVHMAEGRDGLLLGRLRFNERRARL